MRFLIPFFLSMIFLLETTIANPSDLHSEEIAGVEGIIKNVLAPDLATHGPALFLELFKLEPGYQKLFTKFADVTVNSLKDNAALKAHSVNILGKFAGCVLENIKSADKMQSCFKGQAQTHKKLNVGYDHAKVLSKAIQNYLSANLPSGFGGDVKTGWNKVLYVMTEAFK